MELLVLQDGQAPLDPRGREDFREIKERKGPKV